MGKRGRIGGQGGRTRTAAREWMMANPRSPVAAGQAQYPCETCAAKPGDWCHTASGGTAKQLHMSRYYAAMRVRGEQSWEPVSRCRTSTEDGLTVGSHRCQPPARPGAHDR